MTPKKVLLVVEKGQHKGACYELVPHGYRAVGRDGGAVVTMQFTADGDQQLDPEDLARVEEHLARRSAARESEAPGLRIGSFRRGRDILLQDSKISRTHAMFFLDDDGPSVVDLFSTNGTLVNGTKVHDADLHDGDVVHIGQTRFGVKVE